MWVSQVLPWVFVINSISLSRDYGQSEKTEGRMEKLKVTSLKGLFRSVLILANDPGMRKKI